MPGLAPALAELSGALVEAGAVAARTLLPGAGDLAVGAALAGLAGPAGGGVAEVAELYRWHDGMAASPYAELFPGGRLLDVAAARAAHDRHLGSAESFVATWERGWLPVFGADRDVVHAVVLAEGASGARVISASGEHGGPSPAYDDLESWARTTAACWRGRLYRDDGGYAVVTDRRAQLDLWAGLNPGARAARRAIALAGRPVEAVLAALGGPDEGAAWEAATTLVEIDEPATVGAIRACLGPGAGLHTRRVAAWTLGELGRPDGAEALLAAATEDPSGSVRIEAARALAAIDPSSATGPLLRMLESADAEILAEAIHLLGELGDPAASGPVAALASTGRPRDVVAMAAAVLGRLGDPGAAPVLSRLLGDPDALVRRNAAGALGALGASASLDALVRLAGGDPDADVRLHAGAAAESLRAALDAG